METHPSTELELRESALALSPATDASGKIHELEITEEKPKGPLSMTVGEFIPFTGVVGGLLFATFQGVQRSFIPHLQGLPIQPFTILDILGIFGSIGVFVLGSYGVFFAPMAVAGGIGKLKGLTAARRERRALKVHAKTAEIED